ncbi:hypothetical protein [Orientia tsutsugamushi]|uniref:hypothetical protein n=1 Tax=Orientia tsutsugamushi TaxID=784 RepID=UPI00130522C0
MSQHSEAYQYERAERLGVSKSSIQKALKNVYLITSYLVCSINMFSYLYED